MQDAGCFFVVLECVPAAVAAAATSAFRIPTIGTGAVPFCSSQLDKIHGKLKNRGTRSTSGKVTPKFCKQYARVGDVNQALLRYKEEMTEKSSPGPTRTV